MNADSWSPRVSVVLPVFDAVGTIASAVESIRRQTFPDWELVIVDDGSTDGTREVLERIGREDGRVRIRFGPHAGLVSALEAGLAAARGRWIARMDADDLSSPERLERQVAWLEARPSTGVVGCRVEYGGDRTAQAGYAAHVDWLNSVISADQIEHARFIDAPVAHPSVLFRRECVERFGGYRDGPFPEDYELWLRWMENGVRFEKVPEFLVRWNDPADRLSRRDSRYEPEAFFRLKAGFLARWLRSRLEPGRPLYAWGAGRLTRRRIEWLEHELQQGGAGRHVEGFVDIDPRKVGRRPDGRRVLSPTAFAEVEGGFVVGYVANRGARDWQRQFLESRGRVEGRDFLFAA